MSEFWPFWRCAKFRQMVLARPSYDRNRQEDSGSDDRNALWSLLAATSSQPLGVNSSFRKENFPVEPTIGFRKEPEFVNAYKYIYRSYF
jgi:hypothetical protein